MTTTKNHITDSDIRDRLRMAGLRITAVRVGILRLMDASPTALTAQEVSDQLKAWWDLQQKDGKREADGVHGPKPDRVTVYRTLNSLVETGMAHRVDPGDRVFRFGLNAADAAGRPARDHDQPHPHFVCDSCGGVECMEEADVVVKAAPGAKRRVTHQEVQLHGLCSDCDTPSGRKKSGKGR